MHRADGTDGRSADAPAGSQPVHPRRAPRRACWCTASAERRSSYGSLPRASPAPDTPSLAASSPATAARPRSCAARPGSEWYASVEAAPRPVCGSTATSSLPAACRWAASWPLHLAQNRPGRTCTALLLVRADAQARRLVDALVLAGCCNYIRPLPIRFEFDLAEHEPYGLKDERACARSSSRACRAAMPAWPASSARRCGHSPISTRWSRW